ncbi:MAG: lipid A deacylase LpxR family protein [Bacteroidota bacterium]
MPARSASPFAFCFIVALSLFVSLQAQQTGNKNFSKQISVVTDNDRYLLQGNDRYYTNGLVARFSKLHPVTNAKTLKRVDHFEVGQKLFTPYSRKIYDVTQIDRPVTGYLYGKYTQSRFLVRNQLVELGASLGTIGKASLGEAMQNSFHKLIGVNSEWWGWIWDYQLKSEPSINLHGKYAVGLLNETSSFFQLTPVTQATLGTGFTNISQGVLIQLGRFNHLHESAYWNAVTQNTSTPAARTEIFFYYHPEVSYQAYNATVQGGLFRKDKGPIVSSPKPFMFVHQVGGMLSISRYILKLEAVLQSKEAKSQLFDHNYGSIQVSYLFN